MFVRVVEDIVRPLLAWLVSVVFVRGSIRLPGGYWIESITLQGTMERVCSVCIMAVVRFNGALALCQRRDGGLWWCGLKFLYRVMFFMEYVCISILFTLLIPGTLIYATFLLWYFVLLLQ